VHDRLDVIARGGCRQQNVLGAGADVLLEILTPNKRARALEDNVHVDIAPRQP